MQLEIIIFIELSQMPKENAACLPSFVVPRFYIVKYNDAWSYDMKLEVKLCRRTKRTEKLRREGYEEWGHAHQTIYTWMNF